MRVDDDPVMPQVNPGATGPTLAITNQFTEGKGKQIAAQVNDIVDLADYLRVQPEERSRKGDTGSRPVRFVQ